MAEAVAEVSGVDVLSYTSLSEAKEAVLEALKDHEEFHSFKVKIQLTPSLGHLLNEVFEAVVEMQLWQPTIVMDYPTVISPYARPHEAHSNLAQRFEIFVAGLVTESISRVRVLCVSRTGTCEWFGRNHRRHCT